MTRAGQRSPTEAAAAEGRDPVSMDTEIGAASVAYLRALDGTGEDHVTSSCAALAAIALAKAPAVTPSWPPINPHLLPSRRRPASGMPDTRTSSPRSTNSSVRNVSEAEWQYPQASRDFRT